MNKEDFLEAIKQDGVYLVDIREAQELTSFPSNLPANHLPLSVILPNQDFSSLPKDKKIITFCQSGGRSTMLNTLLVATGYDADYLEGGLSTL